VLFACRRFGQTRRLSYYQNDRLALIPPKGGRRGPQVSSYGPRHCEKENRTQRSNTPGCLSATRAHHVTRGRQDSTKLVRDDEMPGDCVLTREQSAGALSARWRPNGGSR